MRSPSLPLLRCGCLRLPAPPLSPACVCAGPRPESPLPLCLGFCVQTTEKGNRVCVALIHPVSLSICTQTPSRRPAPAPGPSQQPQQVLQPASLTAAERKAMIKAQAAAPSTAAASPPSLPLHLISFPAQADAGRAREGPPEGIEVGERSPAQDFTKTHTHPQLESSFPLSPSPPDPMLHPRPHRCIRSNISPSHPHPTNCHSSFCRHHPLLGPPASTPGPPICPPRPSQKILRMQS